MLPADPATCLRARLWDRFVDLSVQDPMQRIVFDPFRPEDREDRPGVESAEQRLLQAFEMVDTHMQDRTSAAGDAFGIADCSAAPALFFAGIIVPFGSDRAALRGYLERLVECPSFGRVPVRARPFFGNFPFHDRIPGVP